MARNTLREDPTRTATLRNRLVSQINRRYNALKGGVNKTIIENKVFLVNIDAAEPADFEGKSQSERMIEFERWLGEAIFALIIVKELDNTIPSYASHWFTGPIWQSYVRGAEKQNRKLSNIFTPEIVPKRNISKSSTHQNKVKIILARDFEQLKGITETMSQQIMRELSEGLLNGDSPRVIARAINDRIDKIGKVRSRLLARTEIVFAHNSAAIQEADIISGEIGEPIYHEWVDSEDSLVRPEHRLRDDKIYTSEAVQPLIGEPNCRCALAPVPESQLDGRDVIGL
jgi:SPP1 gp7 family putative phage head morphogenesis protein